jgi:hypothetical protein
MTDVLPGKEPVPVTPPSQPITGDSHRHLIAPLIAHAAGLGYSVEIRDLPENGPGGWCEAKRKQIVVATGPANRQVRKSAPSSERGRRRPAPVDPKVGSGDVAGPRGRQERDRIGDLDRLTEAAQWNRCGLLPVDGFDGNAALGRFG